MTWREQRVQEMADLINGHPFDSADFTHDGDLPLVRIRDILGSSFETFVSRDVVPESALVRDGDVVIGMDGDFNVVYWTRGEAALNQRLCLLRANGRADMRFVAYALPTHLKVINDLTYATTVKHLSSGQVRAVRMLAPDPAEQRAIADYLDRETARIDTLIDEQQRLIEMLRERRRDLIRAAVLGTENPFSPSAYAAFTAIGHHFSVTLGKMLDTGKKAGSEDRWLPYIRAGNIQDYGLNLSDVNEMPYSEAEAARLDLRSGDLLVVEGGAVGTNVVVREDMLGWSFQKTVNRLRPTGGWSSAWLGYVLRTYRDIGVIDIVCNKSTIPHLTAEKLRAMRVPSVPPEEQLRIVSRLDAETAKIDALIAETERFVELSRERRSALITDAVTGQIDVREVA